jgi:methionyl-tRNA formyltransferase
MKYIIITKKIWDRKNFEKINKKIFILNKVNNQKIKKINPNIIFFIHWSKLIEESLFNKYLCIQFHSSSLPKGRGGSPIQNQILLNFNKTKLTAFKVSKNLDSGPVCMKKNLSLKGSAFDIFKRMEKTSVQMIKKIINKKKISFIKQKGKPTYFKRRKENDSEINFKNFFTIKRLYNFLRMLDAPDYPNAFIRLNKYKFSFNNVRMYKNKINARVEIIKNEKK